MTLSLRQTIFVVIGLVGVFGGLLYRNFAEKKDWSILVAEQDARLTALAQDIATARAREAALGEVCADNATLFAETITRAEEWIDRGPDDRMRSAWNTYRIGATANRYSQLQVRKKLDELQRATKELGQLVDALHSVQGGLAVLPRAAAHGASDVVMRQQIDGVVRDARAALTVAVLFIAETKSEVAELSHQLHEQRDKIDSLWPKGVAATDAASQRSYDAVKFTLEGVDLVIEALDQLDEVTTQVGRAVFSLQGVVDTQDEYLRAR